MSQGTHLCTDGIHTCVPTGYTPVYRWDTHLCSVGEQTLVRILPGQTAAISTALRSSLCRVFYHFHRRSTINP